MNHQYRIIEISFLKIGVWKWTIENVQKVGYLTTSFMATTDMDNLLAHFNVKSTDALTSKRFESDKKYSEEAFFDLLDKLRTEAE